MKIPKDIRKNMPVCDCFIKWILDNIPKGSIILELGSGFGTTFKLSKSYKMYSVEDDPKWVGVFDTTYIYAPKKNKYYDVDILKEKIPKKYDVIIIDGPKSISRIGFFDHIDLFNTDSIMIFDDTNRKADRSMLKRVCKKLDKKSKDYDCCCDRVQKKKFSVLNF